MTKAIPCTRRSVIFSVPQVVAAVGLSNLLLPEGAFAQATASRVAREFGGSGGDWSFPMQYPFSIGLAGDKLVDAIVVNGGRYGGGGGGNVVELTLGDTEYWSMFNLRSGDVMDRLEFRTNINRSIAAGADGGDPWGVQNIKILRIGGKYGTYLDHIKIEYVENYQPSTVLDAEAFAVIDFRPGGQKITQFLEEKRQSAQAYEKITEHMQEFSLNASAEADYYAKFSVSTGLKTTDTTKVDIKQSAAQATTSSSGSEETIAPDEVAFLVVNINVMKDSNGSTWVYPTQVPNWVKLKETRFSELLNYYDLTSGVSTQTGLKRHAKNGLFTLGI